VGAKKRIRIQKAWNKKQKKLVKGLRRISSIIENDLNLTLLKIEKFKKVRKM
jgi:hypothetical protein